VAAIDYTTACTVLATHVRWLSITNYNNDPHSWVHHTLSLAVMHHTVTGRATGPDICVSLWHKFTLATLFCWHLTSIALGIRTPLHVPTATVQKKRQSTFFAMPDTWPHLSGDVPWPPNIIQPKMPLYLLGGDQGSDCPPDWEWERQKEREYNFLHNCLLWQLVLRQYVSCCVSRVSFNFIFVLWRLHASCKTVTLTSLMLY